MRCLQLARQIGFEVKHDIPVGEHRWLTVVGKDNPKGTELLLEPSEHPVLDVFGNADRVASRSVSTGTRQGYYWGIEPAGRKIAVQEISIFRCAAGRVAEQWCMIEEFTRLQQLRVDEIQLRKALKL